MFELLIRFNSPVGASSIGGLISFGARYVVSKYQNLGVSQASQQPKLALSNTSSGNHSSTRTSIDSDSCFSLPRAYHVYIVSTTKRHNTLTQSLSEFWSRLLLETFDWLLLVRYLFSNNIQGQETSQQHFSETTNRLRSLFGSGWFFEWPGGKRPLNSTWPWADVKPSLLVLWGVCWMFVVAPVLQIPQRSLQVRQQNYRRDQRSPSSQHQHNSSYYYLDPETVSPIVKMEHSHSHSSHTPSPLQSQSQSQPRRDWPPYQPTPSPLDEPYLYTHNPMQHQYQQQQQPIHVAAHRSRQAETAQLAMRNARPTGRVTGALSPAQAQGCLSDFSTTNTSAHARAVAVAGAAEKIEGALAICYPNVANQRTDTDRERPDISGESLGHQGFLQHNQQHRGSYYDAPRHSKPQYQHSPAALTPLSAESTPFYPFSTDVMSISYAPSQPFSGYPESSMMHQDPHEDDNSLQHPRYPSPPAPMENPYNAQPLDATAGINMEIPELPHKEESDAASPGRSRPIPKPDREVTKGEDGRYVCTRQGCQEEAKSFNRKCEWSKHMDKHDRPYKCPADGCEKLPGFTYSGGLLRHQREVHNLHGGPRKQLNCPHPNCKRHSGKGFSRQENLNEHMRRVHTPGEGNMENGEDETEENDDGSERAGMKRKRGGQGRGDEGDLRTEMARLRAENEELRRQSELQTRQTSELMRQLNNLQTLVSSQIGQASAAQALM